MQSVMRSGSDAQWWAYRVPTDGTYEVRLSQLPNNYGLTVFYPGGSASTTSTSTTDRVRSVQLRAGDRVSIEVSVESGGFSSSAPYRVTVSKTG